MRSSHFALHSDFSLILRSYNRHRANLCSRNHETWMISTGFHQCACLLQERQIDQHWWSITLNIIMVLCVYEESIKSYPRFCLPLQWVRERLLILSEFYREKEYRILLNCGMYFPVQLSKIYVEHYDLLSSLSLFLFVCYSSPLPFGHTYLFMS